MFKQNLLNLKHELQYHKRDRDYLMKHFIIKRLNVSLTTYFKNLESSVYTLSVADPERVIKEM